MTETVDQTSCELQRIFSQVPMVVQRGVRRDVRRDAAENRTRSRRRVTSEGALLPSWAMHVGRRDQCTTAAEAVHNIARDTLDPMIRDGKRTGVSFV